MKDETHLVRAHCNCSYLGNDFHSEPSPVHTGRGASGAQVVNNLTFHPWTDIASCNPAG